MIQPRQNSGVFRIIKEKTSSYKTKIIPVDFGFWMANIGVNRDSDCNATRDLVHLSQIDSSLFFFVFLAGYFIRGLKMNELTMDKMQFFSNKEFKVRVVSRLAEPWFVAKDVCECLDLGNVSQTCSRLEDDERGIISIDTPSGKQDMIVISEPGLYSLIGSSKKPEAKSFKRWVNHEVLPSIRQTGRYEVKQSIPDFSNPAEAARAWADAYEEKQKAQLALEEEKVQHQKDNEDFCEGLRILEQKKSEICSRREATAMNTASQKSKECAKLTKENEHLTQENEQLRDECGRGKEWQTTSDNTKEWIKLFGHKPDGKKLTNLSFAMGVPCPKDVYRTFEMGNSGRYREDKVRRYRKDVWEKYKELEASAL